MTALAAALKVLQDANTPLHYRDITKRIVSAKLWETDGKTPEATINAQLSVAHEYHRSLCPQGFDAP